MRKVPGTVWLVCILALSAGLGGCQAGRSSTPAPAFLPTGGAANPLVSPERLNTTPLNNLISEQLAPAGEGSTFNCFEGGELPYLASNGTEREIGQGIGIYACGWKQDEVVTVTVVDAQGQSHSQAYPSTYVPGLKYAYVFYFYQPALDAKPGSYHFTFTGVEKKVEMDVSFHEALTPHIQVAAPPPSAGVASQKEQTLWLYGFQANEVVRLIAFQGGKYAGWQDFVLNQTGRLELTLSLPDSAEWSFWGYNNQYGLLAQTRLSADGVGLEQYVDLVYCPKAPPRKAITQIKEDSSVTVKANPGKGKTLPIYDIAGDEGSVLHEAAQGEEIVLDGRVSCVADTLWWQVQLGEDSGIGWVAETSAGEYVLLPQK
jgi:hypothetical protein